MDAGLLSVNASVNIPVSSLSHPSVNISVSSLSHPQSTPDPGGERDCCFGISFIFFFCLIVVTDQSVPPLYLKRQPTGDIGTVFSYRYLYAKSVQVPLD